MLGPGPLPPARPPTRAPQPHEPTKRAYSTQTDDVRRGDGLVEALELEIAHRLHVDQVLDRRANAGGDDDLSVRRGVAQARSQVGNAADRGVVVAPLESHLAQGGVAHRNANREAEVVRAPLPALRHRGHLLTHG